MKALITWCPVGTIFLGMQILVFVLDLFVSET